MKKQPWDIVLKDRFLNAKKRDNPFVVAFLYFIIFFLSFLLIFLVFFQLCLIDGDSMNNTLYDGDHVLLLKSNNYIEFGDIVVITKQDTNHKKYNIIKRVIGLEGDQIMFKESDGKITLHRKPKNSSSFYEVKESYILEDMKMFGSWFTAKPNSDPITIAEGCLFVLGDNRNNSEDSRGKDGQYTINAVYGEMVINVEKGSILEFFLKILYQDQKSLIEDN